MYIIMDRTKDVITKRKREPEEISTKDVISTEDVKSSLRGAKKARGAEDTAEALLGPTFSAPARRKTKKYAVKKAAAPQCHCPDDFTITKKEACIDKIPDYEPGSIIKALLVEHGFINEQGDVVNQEKEEIPYIISIPPNKASSSNSIMNWLKDSTEPSNLKPITITSVRSSTQNTPSEFSFLDNFLKISNGSFSLDKTTAFHFDHAGSSSQKVAETITASVTSGRSIADNKLQYIILITTHGTIFQDKTIVPSSYNKTIVKITASTPGTVNYIIPGEVTGWEDEIKNIATLGTHFDTMGTIGANIKNFAESQSPYYKRAVQLQDEFGSGRLSSAIQAWGKCSLIDSKASITAKEDFQNYYDNGEFGYHSWYIERKQEAMSTGEAMSIEETGERFYDKLYTNKGLLDNGSKDGLRCKNMKLGLIQIFDCSGEKWEDDFTIMRDPSNNGGGCDNHVTWDNTSKYKECKLSDILYTIKSNTKYDDVVIIDLTCSVPSKGYLDCLYGLTPRYCLSKGGSKSKKRKRKSNKTRKRRRKPSRNPRKHKKHQKSKRNPNKRRTKRK
jgi:hypothetical protein